MHDEIASDKRDPTVNANGLIYGATEESTQDLPVLDPVKNTATTIHIPVRDPNTPNSADNQMLRPSPYWGDEKIWASQASVHNPMFDRGAASGSPPGSAARTIRRSARPGRTTRRRNCSRSRNRRGNWRCTIRRPRNSP